MPRLLVTLAFVLMVVACAGGTTPPTRVRLAASPPEGFRDSARREHILATTAKLESKFAELMTEKKLPGLAVGLVVDGDLVWSKGYGVRDLATGAPVDADTVFRIGSITKTFTAIAALQLRDAGRLSLDEPAARWIPELDEVLYPTSDSPRITMRALLTHTSGLPHVGAFSYMNPAHAPTESEVTASLRGLSLHYAPETSEEYSNLGVGLAGIVVGRAAGASYRDYVTKHLLEPLGMSSTMWDRDAVPAERLATAYVRTERGELERKDHWRLGASEGAGGIYTTVRDMSRWAALHLQAFPPRSDPDPWPVRRATLREAMTIHRADRIRAQSVESAGPTTSGVGFAWHAFEDCELERVVWHNGGTEGYSSMVALLPERGVAIVALTNLFEAHAALAGTTFAALHMLAATGAMPPRKAAVSPIMIEARNRLLGLFERWDEGEARQLFADEFLKTLGGPSELHKSRDAMVEELGACKPAGDVEAGGALQAQWALTCERKTTECHAWFEAPGQLKLIGLRCGPRKTTEKDTRCP